MIFDESKVTQYSSDLKSFCGEQVGDLGKITHIALNYTKSVMSIFSEQEGTLFVLKSDLSQLFKKFTTMLPTPT